MSYLLQGVVDVLFTQPLRQLYFSGMRMCGFWNGMQEADICASLAPGLPATYWITQPQACTLLMETHFEAFHTTVWSTCYFLALSSVVGYFVLCCVCTCPPWRRSIRSYHTAYHGR